MACAVTLPSLKDTPATCEAVDAVDKLFIAVAAAIGKVLGAHDDGTKIMPTLLNDASGDAFACQDTAEVVGWVDASLDLLSHLDPKMQFVKWAKDTTGEGA